MLDYQKAESKIFCHVLYKRKKGIQLFCVGVWRLRIVKHLERQNFEMLENKVFSLELNNDLYNLELEGVRKFSHGEFVLNK